MRGSDDRSGDLFSYVDLEGRIPARHALRVIRRVVNEVLVVLDGEFSKIYAGGGRPSIPPERLLRALLLQAFYTIRSETQLMEQLHYNLLYRWFVGLGVDEPVWVPTVFTKNASGCWRQKRAKQLEKSAGRTTTYRADSSRRSVIRVWIVSAEVRSVNEARDIFGRRPWIVFMLLARVLVCGRIDWWSHS
jgi:Transposase domain (DUF772)